MLVQPTKGNGMSWMDNIDWCHVYPKKRMEQNFDPFVIRIIEQIELIFPWAQAIIASCDTIRMKQMHVVILL